MHKEKGIDNIEFDNLLDRFYENQELRLEILRLTEKVEIALKTQIAYILETNSTNYTDYINFIIEDNNGIQVLKNRFLGIEKATSNLSSELLQNYVKKEKEIPIYLILDIFTFGEILKLFKLLNKEDRNKIAYQFNLKFRGYISFMEYVKLGRNLSAHLCNVLDFSFKTLPKFTKNRENIRKKVYLYKKIPTNKIALLLVVLEYLILAIDKDYDSGKIKGILKKICKNKTNKEAKKLGFRNYKEIEKLKI